MTKTIYKGNKHRSEPTEVPAAARHATAAPTGVDEYQVVSVTDQQTTDCREEAIRKLAHQKWEAAGCPAGDGFDFWLEAENEVDGNRSVSTPAQG